MKTLEELKLAAEAELTNVPAGTAKENFLPYVEAAYAYWHAKGDLEEHQKWEACRDRLWNGRKLIAQAVTLGSGRQVLEDSAGNEIANINSDGWVPYLQYTSGPQMLSEGGWILYRATLKSDPVWVLPLTTGQGIQKIFFRDFSDEVCKICGVHIGGEFASKKQAECDVCQTGGRN